MYSNVLVNIFIVNQKKTKSKVSICTLSHERTEKEQRKSYSSAISLVGREILDVIL